MALQSKRHSKTAKRTRRGAIKIKKTSLASCPKCKSVIKPHTVCKVCGSYKGKEVVKVKMKKNKSKK